MCELCETWASLMEGPDREKQSISTLLSMACGMFERYSHLHPDQRPKPCDSIKNDLTGVYDMAVSVTRLEEERLLVSPKFAEENITLLHVLERVFLWIASKIRQKRRMNRKKKQTEKTERFHTLSFWKQTT